LKTRHQWWSSKLEAWTFIVRLYIYWLSKDFYNQKYYFFR